MNKTRLTKYLVVAQLIGGSISLATAETPAILLIGSQNKGQIPVGNVQSDAQWVVNVRAGQLLSIEVSSLEFDSYLSVQDPLGNIVGEDDNSGPGTNARLQFKGGLTGLYRVIVRGSRNDEGGTYRITVIDGGVKPWTKTDKARADLSYYQAANSAWEEKHGLSRKARLLIRLAETHAALGNHARAVTSYEETLKVLSQVPDAVEEAKALGGLGLAQSRLGQFEKAIEYFSRAREAAKVSGDRAEESNWTGYLGGGYLYLGQYENAAQILNRAVDLARQATDRPMEGKWLTQLGRTYLLQGRSDRAIINYEQALTIIRDGKDFAAESRICQALASLYENIGEYNKSIEHAKNALTLARKLKDHRRETELAGKLGTLYLRLGQYQEGIANLELAVTLARKLKRQEGAAVNTD